MKNIISIFIFLMLALTASAQANVNILKTEYAQPGVAESFKAGSDWYPYPAYSDRKAWKELLTRTAKEKYIKKAEQCLNYKWQHIPASSFLTFNITGDKQEMRKPDKENRNALMNLMMGELAEGKGRFLKDIADGLWFYGTSYHWHHSNQTYEQLPQYEMEKIGLGCVRLGVTIPVVYHFFKEEMDKMDKRIGIVVEEAVKRIIIDPAMEGYGTDKFRWLGPISSKKNNWNPWCNHGCLFAILLMEKDQDKINAAVKASIENVDEYLAAYAIDSACEEGAGYWGQSVGRFCEYLQLLYDASGGKFDVFDNEFVKRMAEYPSRAYAGINKSGENYKVNFGDGSATGGSAPLPYYKVGVLFGHDELKDFAVYQTFNMKRQRFEHPSLTGSEGFRQLENVRHYKDICAEVNKLNNRIKDGESVDNLLAELRGKVPHMTWYPVTQQAMLRSTDNWFVGAKAGNNGEVHGHNDVGSFVCYAHNIPFLVDPGVGTYVKDTFGKNRYTIWSMTSDWHNCPAPNGVHQMNGKTFGASSCTLKQEKKQLVMRSEFAGAYPQEAACKSYVRTLRLSDSKTNSSLTIEDEYELTERKAADEVHFITPGKVTLVSKGILTIELEGEVLKISYPDTLVPEVEEQPIKDKKFKKDWNDFLYAIRFKSAPDAPLKGSYRFVMQMK